MRCTGNHLDLWLNSLYKPELSEVNFCQKLYAIRHTYEMQFIAKQWPDPGNSFRQIRHYVGRIGSYIRIAERLTELAPFLCTVLSDFQVRWLKTPPPQPPPALDSKSNLSSIAGRMIPSHKKEVLEHCREKLEFMNQKFNLEDRYLRTYCDESFRPRVHAELALLEYFYGKKFEFFGSDRFIGCSKPACYCCALYINGHPGNFETPASHQKIYINWLVPQPSEEILDASPNHQRDMINGMLTKIRQDVLDQISGRSQPYPYQPDSTTGITAETQMSQSNTASKCSSFISEGQGVFDPSFESFVD